MFSLKKLLCLTLALSAISVAKADGGGYEVDYNQRILWSLGTAIGMGLFSKSVRTNWGHAASSFLNYTKDEVDFVTSVSGVLSVMRIVDQSPMTRRWTAGLWVTMIGHKLWSSYWMRELLNLGAGALGQSIFPQQDIDRTKNEYNRFRECSYYLKYNLKEDLSDDDKRLYEEKRKFVEDYSYRKRSSLATTAMVVASVPPLLPLIYKAIQKYSGINMGIAAV